MTPRALSRPRAMLYCIALALAIMLQAASAAPPSIVYRAAGVPPDQVFAEGFPNHGTNADTLDHVGGLSCFAGSSAFVATTEAEAFAVERATHALLYTFVPSREFYIYRIRPTDNFYSAEASLMEAARLLRNDDYRRAADDYRHEAEWMAYHGVQASQVVSVDVYQRAAGRTGITRVAVRANPNYVDATTLASEHPYFKPTARSSASFDVAGPSSAFTHVSACFACDPGESNHTDAGATNPPDADRHTDLKRAALETHCPVFYINRGDKPAAVIDPLTGNLVRRFVPWRTDYRRDGGAYVEYPNGCVVSAGTGEPGEPDRMTVDCGAVPHVSRFGVAIGAGGSSEHWVGAVFRDGRRGTQWARSASQIGTTSSAYSMHDYRHTIYEVFGGQRSDWWSSIVVAPYYPEVPTPDGFAYQPVCFFRDAGFEVSMFCLQVDGVERGLTGSRNDSISSISASPSQRYQVCEHYDFQGKCVVLRGKASYDMLFDLGLNDKISSVRVCANEAPRTTRLAPDNRGFVGDVYVYDNPSSGERDYFQLLSPGAYPPIPTNRASDAHWRYLRHYDACA